MFGLFKKKKEPKLTTSMRLRIQRAPAQITEVVESPVKKFNERYKDPFKQKEHVSLGGGARPSHPLNRNKKKGKKTIKSLDELSSDPFIGG